MTRIKDRAGYGRTMPARLWWLRLAPRWAWRRWPRTSLILLAAAALACCAAGAAAGGGHAGQQCHPVPQKYARSAGGCR